MGNLNPKSQTVGARITCCFCWRFAPTPSSAYKPLDAALGVHTSKMEQLSAAIELAEA